uniref:Uncharacterized protein n=1 Tax=Rhizophora mucronata TaxID=61149 RepID=A0A2P2QY51_RHIMU
MSVKKTPHPQVLRQACFTCTKFKILPVS